MGYKTVLIPVFCFDLEDPKFHESWAWKWQIQAHFEFYSSILCLWLLLIWRVNAREGMLCVSVCECARVCACMCVCVCVARGQPSGMFFSDYLSFCCCCFEPVSLPSLKLIKYAKTAGQQVPGTCLSPSSQGWGLQSPQPSACVFWRSDSGPQACKANPLVDWANP